MTSLTIPDTKEAQQAASLAFGAGGGFVHKQNPDGTLVDTTAVIEGAPTARSTPRRLLRSPMPAMAAPK